MVHAYLWVVVVGGIFSFLVACGNGANDLANSFGTSYGSRVMTLLQIIILASICEFSGAVGLGSGVTKTISSGIARGSVFADEPDILMYGFLCTVISTAFWLFLATWKDLTVSSHQSIAGSIMGFALVYGGGNAVIWAARQDEFPYVGGVVPIVLSWIISPPLSAAASMIIYAAIRYLLLQRSYAVRLAVQLFPIIAGLTVFLEFLFIFFIAAQNRLTWSPSQSTWVAALIGVGAGVLCIPLMPLLRRAINTMVSDAIAASQESGLTVKNAMRNILAKGRPYVDGGNQSTAPHPAGGGKSRFCDPTHTGGLTDQGEAMEQPLVYSIDNKNTDAALGSRQEHDSHAIHYANDAIIMSGNAAVYVHSSPIHDNNHHHHNNNDDIHNNSNNNRNRVGLGGTSSMNSQASPSAGEGAKPLEAPPAAVGAVVSADDCSGADEPHTGEDGVVGMTREETAMNSRGGVGHRHRALGHTRSTHTDSRRSHSTHESDDAEAAGGHAKTQPSTAADTVNVSSRGHWKEMELEDEYDASGVRLFDPRAEYIFRYLQIFTAASMSLAHGANDVSNSIGPFSAIHQIYNTGNVAATSTVPLWLLCMGGAGIIVGLSTYGLNIMRLLGEKLAFITPARGFAAELATALVVSFATIYSLPVSTTQCVTGAVIGVNILDVGFKGLKWNIIIRVYLGWVATLLISGAISAALFAQGIYAPSSSS